MHKKGKTNANKKISAQKANAQDQRSQMGRQRPAKQRKLRDKQPNYLLSWIKIIAAPDAVLAVGTLICTGLSQ